MGHLKKVFIDPGHGGRDPGAVSPFDGVTESSIVTVIGNRIAKLCGQHDAIVYRMSRYADDVDPHNTTRAKKANEYKADLFVALHCNAAENRKANGYEIIIAPKNKKAMQAAQNVVSELSKIDGLNGRNPAIKADNELGRGSGFKLTVLRNTKMPAILIEMGFLSNVADHAFLIDSDNQSEIASRIFNGIVDYFGLKPLKTNPKEDKPMTDETKPETKPEEIKPPVPVEEPKPNPPEENENESALIAAWAVIAGIFSGGKIKLADIPALLSGIAEFLIPLSALLVAAPVPPAMKAVIPLIGSIMESLAKQIADNMDDIEKHWKTIEKLLHDNKIRLHEIPPFITAVVGILEILLGISAPYIEGDSVSTFRQVLRKLANIGRWSNDLMGMMPGFRAGKKSLPMGGVRKR